MAPRKTGKKQEPKKIVPEAAAQSPEEQPDEMQSEQQSATKQDNEKAPGEQEQDETTVATYPEAENGDSEEPAIVPGSTPWEPVPELSDGEMVIECCNFAQGAYQKKSLLLRIRVGGKLTGQVILVNGFMWQSGRFKSDRG